MSTYPTPPTHPGLKFVEVTNIAVDTFANLDQSNEARVSVTNDSDHVKNLIESLRNNGWRHELGYPVAALDTDTNRPVLIDGHHRLEAWTKLGHTTIPCYYYKKTQQGTTLKSIARVFGIKLNAHPPHKVNAKADVIQAMSRFIEDRNLDLSIDEIKVLYKSEFRLRNFSSSQVNTIAKEVYNKTHTNQIRFAKKEVVEQHVQDYPNEYGDVDYIAPCTDGPMIDYASRNLKDIVTVYNNTGEKQRTVIYALKINTPSEVYRARVRGIEKMEELFDLFRDAAKTLKPGEYPWDIVAAYPQIPALEGDKPVRG